MRKSVSPFLDTAEIISNCYVFGMNGWTFDNKFLLSNFEAKLFLSIDNNSLNQTPRAFNLSDAPSNTKTFRGASALCQAANADPIGT